MRQIINVRERSDRIIAFIEKLKVPTGKHAGKFFKLDPFQIKFIRDVYDPHWLDEDGIDWVRVVRNAIFSIPRKNGKTALIACLVLAHLVGPEAELNNEIYSAANDKKQAAIVFKMCSQIVLANDELKTLLNVVTSTKTISCYSNGSSYEAMSREAGTKHGSNPGLVIYDELAQAKDMELFEVLDSSMGARVEPLMIVISTQSKDPEHILSQMIDDGLSSHDPTIVCHLYAVDDEVEDIFDEAVWRKSNPALGNFLSIDYIRQKATRAKRMPSFENSFRNLHLNQRVDSTPSLISRVEWINCTDKNMQLIPGEDVYLGLDLSGTIDLSALVAISAHGGDRVLPFLWKPKDTLEEHAKRDRAPYIKWEKEGHLLTTPGKSIDLGHIALQIARLDNEFNILGLAYDRHRMEYLIKDMETYDIDCFEGDIGDADGIRLVKFGQGFVSMAPAIDALETSIITGKFRHNGNPVLTWNFSNAVALSDPAGNRKLDKKKARFRIDGAVATVMAKGLKSRDMLEPEEDLDDFLNNPLTLRAG